MFNNTEVEEASSPAGNGHPPILHHQLMPKIVNAQQNVFHLSSLTFSIADVGGADDADQNLLSRVHNVEQCGLLMQVQENVFDILHLLQPLVPRPHCSWLLLLAGW